MLSQMAVCHFFLWLSKIRDYCCTSTSVSVSVLCQPCNISWGMLPLSGLWEKLCTVDINQFFLKSLVGFTGIGDWSFLCGKVFKLQIQFFKQIQDYFNFLQLRVHLGVVPPPPICVHSIYIFKCIGTKLFIISSYNHHNAEESLEMMFPFSIFDIPSWNLFLFSLQNLF